MFEINNRNTRMASVASCVSVSIVNFDQVNARRNTSTETQILEKNNIT